MCKICVKYQLKTAFEEVVLQLIERTCLQLAYCFGLEVYPLTKSALRSSDFVITIFFMKLFKITDYSYCGDMSTKLLVWPTE